MERRFFRGDGVDLSYLDINPSSEQILVALHGHFGTASMFAQLAEALPDWRVVSLDQRGHGWSGHVSAEQYSREGYLQDLLILIKEELGGTPVVLLGHSLGGINAYQFAAKHADLVKALIIEDIGAVAEDDQTWARNLPERVPTLKRLRESLEGLLGEGAFTYFQESAVEHNDGWTFRFDAPGLIFSQKMANGDWWEDWEASSCPALLMHGEKSDALSWEHAREMARRRMNTTLIQFPGCGHTIRNGDPAGYAKAVREFLAQLG